MRLAHEAQVMPLIDSSTAAGSVVAGGLDGVLTELLLEGCRAVRRGLAVRGVGVRGLGAVRRRCVLGGGWGGRGRSDGADGGADRGGRAEDDREPGGEQGEGDGRAHGLRP